MPDLGPGLFRLLLAMVVVVHHTSRLAFGTLAVFLFFVLSGYWLARMWESKYRFTSNPYPVFILSRYLRLLPTLVLCVAIAILVNLTIGRHQEIDKIFDTQWFVRSLLIVSSSSQFMALPPKWSIDIEMQFYIIAPALFFLVKQFERNIKTYIYMTLFSITVMTLFYGKYQYPSPTIIPYIGLFLMGAGIHYYKIKFQIGGAIASLIIFSVISALIFAHPTYKYIIIGGPNVIKSIHNLNEFFSFIGAIMLLPFVSYVLARGSSRFDYQIGNLAYPLYLFHFIPIEILKVHYGHLPPVDRLPYVGATYIVIAVGSLLIFWFDRNIDLFRAAFVKSQIRKFRETE